MIEEFIAADIWTIARTNHGSVVFLRPRKSNVAIPVIVGEFELQAILISKEGIKMPRPLTHDLILNLIRQFQFRFKRAEIHSLRNDTFHARLILENGKNTAEKNHENSRKYKHYRIKHKYKNLLFSFNRFAYYFIP